MKIKAPIAKSVVAVLFAGLSAFGAARADAPSDSWPKTDQSLWPLGAFDKANLDKPRPKPPFDMTGTWRMVRDKSTGDFRFEPLPKLTPAAQAEFDANASANAAGKAYKDDTGQCWPAGMPRWLTRVWPIEFLQYPTVIVGIQGLFNAPRWIYLDGRGHASLDIAEPTYSGDSVGRFEGDTLVVDTVNVQSKHHWIQPGVPASDQLHIVERIRMAKDGKSFTDEIVMTDPVNWIGVWKNTKTYVPAKGEDVGESHCLPDTNDHIVATHPEHNSK
jgi:hypothetical protein